MKYTTLFWANKAQKRKKMNYTALSIDHVDEFYLLLRCISLIPS